MHAGRWPDGKKERYINFISEKTIRFSHIRIWRKVEHTLFRDSLKFSRIILHLKCFNHWIHAIRSLKHASRELRIIKGDEIRIIIHLQKFDYHFHLASNFIFHDYSKCCTEPALANTHWDSNTVEIYRKRIN